MSHEFASIRLQVDQVGKTNLSEKDIATKIAHPSAASWKEVFDAVIIPKQVKDLKVLDVGAGASSATSRLLGMGADAYAIDPAYQDMSSLNSYMRFANSHFEGNVQRARIMATRRFNKSVKASSERYIEAFATSIPFTEDYFDIVFSRITILGYLDIDSFILKEAVDECIRATKPGGTIRLFPFKDIEPKWPAEVNTVRLRNNDNLYESLNTDSRVAKVSATTVNLRGVDRKTLIIDKAE